MCLLPGNCLSRDNLPRVHIGGLGRYLACPGSDQLKFLSYNLLKHKAFDELEGIVRKYSPDALCLQEANVFALPAEIGNLRLAVATEKNRLGLAIYLNRTHGLEAADSFRLKDATYDRIASPAHERLLGVSARHGITGEKFTVGSFHASPLTALNSVRRTQIRQGLEKLEVLGRGAPLMMLGDFNYPIFRNRLERELLAADAKLYTSDRRTYKSYGVVRGFFDFAAGRNMELQWMRTLKKGVSDHLPVLLRASFGD